MLAFLSSCGVTNSVCPPIVPYTNEYEWKLADAIERVGDGIIAETLSDYYQLRGRLELCQ